MCSLYLQYKVGLVDYMLGATDYAVLYIVYKNMETLEGGS